MRGTTLSPESKRPQGHSLEEEQGFYIQQLFSRYGQKGRLDFQGFQSLLFSLGLGEVKVVGADHEDLGHDHVAHLDVLDMQEGLHSHSSTKEGHSHGHRHGHGHGHGHGHPHHKPDSHHAHTEQEPTWCTQQTTAASPAAGAPAGHDHEHGHDDGNVQDTHDHDNAHDKEHKHEQSNHKDLSAQPHSDHNHSDHEHNDIHEVQTGKDIAPINREEQPSLQLEPSLVPQEPPSSPATTESQPKKPSKKARVRGQREQNRTTSPLTPLSDDHDHQSKHGDDHSHSHALKDKREAPGGPLAPTLPAPVLSGHPGGLSHQHEEVRLV